MQDVKFENIVPRTKNLAKIQAQKFEREKNTKAFIYAVITFSLLFLLFFIKNWPPPIENQPPPKEDLVEVLIDDANLGNDINGALGDIQPLIKGDFAPPDAGNPTPTKNESSPDLEEPADPIINDKNNDDAPEVDKPPFRPKNPSNTIKPATTPTPNPRVPVNNAPPAPPRPRATMGTPRTGGTGNGNGSDVDNGFRNQGNGRGTGDQGNPYGTPNGTGTRLSNANLRNSGEIERLTNQSGTNYKGKVTLTLRVDDNGNVASIISNSPSPASREAKSFASTIAYKMKFPSGADGRTARIVLDFDF